MNQQRRPLQLNRQQQRITPFHHRHADNYFVMGRQQAEDGVFDDARQLFMRALQYNPRHVRALRALAELEFSLGNAPAARQYLRRVLAIAPSDPEVFFLQGNLAMSEHHAAEALEAYRKAEALGASSPELLYNIGLACLLTGKGEEAAHSFQHVVTQEPTHARAWDALGCAKRMLHDLDGANDAFLRALQYEPELNDARDHLAHMLLEQGQHHRAQQVLDVALTLEPHRRSSRHLLGLACAGLHDYQAAASNWQLIVNAGEASTDTYHLLANAYLHCKDHARAITILEEMLTHFPAHLAAHLQLGLLLLEHGQPERGWAHLEQARALDPTNPAVGPAFTAASAIAPRPTSSPEV